MSYLFYSGLNNCLIHMGSRGKPVVDFGKKIGVALPSDVKTRYGQIHSSRLGAHIVPHEPTLVENSEDSED